MLREALNIPKQSQKGSTLVEYTLLAALIAMAGIVSINGVGSEVRGKLEHVQEKIEAAGATICPPTDPLYPNC
jgi:Flp pilus assembly pilin Flp